MIKKEPYLFCIFDISGLCLRPHPHQNSESAFLPGKNIEKSDFLR